MKPIRLVYDRRLPRGCRWFSKCLRCKEACALRKMVLKERNIKPKGKYEQCWVEHDDHFRVYSWLACCNCPHERDCFEHVCGY